MTTTEAILADLAEHGASTYRHIAERIGEEPPKVRKGLYNLEGQGRVRRAGLFNDSRYGRLVTTWEAV